MMFKCLLLIIYSIWREWNKAKNHYSKAFYMCPNRFVPLNQLHKIAILENDSNMARKNSLFNH